EPVGGDSVEGEAALGPDHDEPRPASARDRDDAPPGSWYADAERAGEAFRARLHPERVPPRPRHRQVHLHVAGPGNLPDASGQRQMEIVHLVTEVDLPGDNGVDPPAGGAADTILARCPDDQVRAGGAGGRGERPT